MSAEQDARTEMIKAIKKYLAIKHGDHDVIIGTMLPVSADLMGLRESANLDTKTEEIWKDGLPLKTYVLGVEGTINLELSFYVPYEEKVKK